MDSATMQRLAFDHPAIEASSQLDAMIRANLMARSWFAIWLGPGVRWGWLQPTVRPPAV